MVIDFDDFGANHVISPQCQAHDCREKLDQLHYANPHFKVTLFAIPFEMTKELLDWCSANSSWVELAVHGFYHSSNYECSEITYDQIDELMKAIPEQFVKGFKAPGWQISDDMYRWLDEHDWWVSDQAYNDHRRPESLPAYVNDNGKFTARKLIGQEDLPTVISRDIESWHGHTWDCVGNGIYETFETVKGIVQGTDNFQFVSEVL